MITGRATDVRLLAGILLLAVTWLPWPAAADSAAIDTSRLYGTWLAQESHPERGKIETVFTILEDMTFSGSMTVNGEVVHVVTTSLETLDDRLAHLDARSRDFR